MHNPIRFKARFSGLIITAFGKPQTLQLNIELTMYQLCSSPEKWTFTPTLPTGAPHPDAPTPEALAAIIESMFVERLTAWSPHRATLSAIHRSLPANVIPIDRKRAS